MRNLAGVPSIVYGLLGLGIFVKALDGLGDPADDLQRNGFLPFRYLGNFLNWSAGNNGRNIFAGGLALSALVLPIVIITASEALRAVPRASAKARSASAPRSGRPCATTCCRRPRPGILTGTVLSLARAAGEAAPLLLVGAITGMLSTGSRASSNS